MYISTVADIMQTESHDAKNVDLVSNSLNEELRL